MNEFDRREFLNRSKQAGLAVAAGATLLGNTQHAHAEKQQESRMPKIAAFTKSFQERSIPEVCRLFKEIGLHGLDLTVRPGGHIEPKNVTKQLPLAHQAAQQEDIDILFLTTGITDDDRNAQEVLAAAAEIGIDRIKLGYYRYGQFGTLSKQITEVQKRIGRIVKLAAKYKILPCVHIHSGAFIPSHGTQLYQLISDFAPEELGAYVDSLHMTLEGGGDGWKQGLDLLAPWISLVAIKNFDWIQAGRDKYGQRLWKRRNVPLADGIASLPDFVGTLQKIGYRGIYSLHSEYKGSHSFQNLDTDGCLRQTTEDFKFFKQLV